MRSLKAASLAATLAFGLGCRPEPPLPPDPEEPTPASSCTEAPPLSLSRIDADSELGRPPWLQVCTVCPVAEVGFTLGDGAGGALPLDAMWTPGRVCAVAAPTTPLPARPSLPGSVALRDDVRAGRLDFDLPIASGRGPTPLLLGTGTYVLPIAEGTSRLPGGLALLEDPPRALAIHLSDPDGFGEVTVTLGEAKDEAGTRQDLCVPTTVWSASAPVSSRQLTAALLPDDELPGRLSARRGSLQARLTETGDALEDVVLLALADLAASEPVLGAPPALQCPAWSAQLGLDPCVPCGSPADGVAGLPACVPLVLEWARAERADWQLVPVDPDAIPFGCRFPGGGDDELADP